MVTFQEYSFPIFYSSAIIHFFNMVFVGLIINLISDDKEFVPRLNIILTALPRFVKLSTTLIVFLASLMLVGFLSGQQMCFVNIIDKPEVTVYVLENIWVVLLFRDLFQRIPY